MKQRPFSNLQKVTRDICGIAYSYFMHTRDSLMDLLATSNTILRFTVLLNPGVP